MQIPDKESQQALKIPRWLAKFILISTRDNPKSKQIFFELLKPMTPSEWCILWIPVIFPDVELPTPGERNPTGYMKACNATLTLLTGYNQRTIEGWFYGKPYHYSVGILLRCLHLIFKLQQCLKN